MKILMTLLALLTNLTWAGSTDKRMICQIEICGPDSFVEVYFTDLYVYFDFTRTRDSYSFDNLLQQTGIITNKQEVEKMYFSLDRKSCQMGRDNLADFSCSDYVSWGSAQIRDIMENEAEYKYKLFEIFNEKSDPWKIDIKSMAAPNPGPYKQYVWNLRLSKGVKSQEENITIGQCAFIK